MRRCIVTCGRFAGENERDDFYYICTFFALFNSGSHDCANVKTILSPPLCDARIICVCMCRLIAADFRRIMQICHVEKWICDVVWDVDFSGSIVAGVKVNLSLICSCVWWWKGNVQFIRQLRNEDFFIFVYFFVVLDKLNIEKISFSKWFKVHDIPIHVRTVVLLGFSGKNVLFSIQWVPLFDVCILSKYSWLNLGHQLYSCLPYELCIMQYSIKGTYWRSSHAMKRRLMKILYNI